MTICPACEEPLKDGAIACTHCGHQLAPIPTTPDSGVRPTPNRWKFSCAIVVLAAFALVLWVFSELYMSTR